jgi:hypothetical protein
MSSGGGNPVKKIGDKIESGTKSVIENPTGSTLYSLIGSENRNYVTRNTLPMRVIDDQRDQAEGMAQKELRRAADAEARAVGASVKDADPLALERRRRASIAAGKGRDGTIATSATSLGAADVARKILLGM